jgi:anti-sigma-K factor RskA
VSDMHDRFPDQPRDRGDDGDDVQTPHDELPAYALGTLDIGERRQFEMHLFVCEACRADLASYERAASLLPYGLAPERPPAGARDRLLARARAEARESPTASTALAGDDEPPTVVQAVPAEEGADEGPPTGPVRRLEPRRGLRISLASLGWAAALLFVIAVGLFVGAWRATGPHASPGIQILARLPGGQLLTLNGTGVPTASARLFVVDDGRRAELAVDALPPLPPGRVYQLWFAEPGQPVRTGGVFEVNPQGDAVVPVAIPTPLERVQAVAVTEEPAPGSPGPTGIHLLDWTPGPSSQEPGVRVSSAD